jgi:8-oxo-dGTP pyrophosphatase MutT (NUDIX family)
MNPSSFAIGVGGHQNLGDEETQRFVAEQFRSLLTTYQQREPHLHLYSALARGADQLFVQIACDLHIPVEIVIPCIAYEEIFASETERQDFVRLLRMARTVHQLPERSCSDDAFLAAEQWMIDHSDLVILAWNGKPSQGRSGTGDWASYARFVGCPFIQIDTRQHCVTTYGETTSPKRAVRTISPKMESVMTRQVVYQGSTLVVNQYHIQMPDGKEIVRDVVTRPESVLILPAGSPDIVLLIEEYNFGAGVWQLTLPGGKGEGLHAEELFELAQQELRQEIGYRAGRLEKLTDFYSHPGYIAHQVYVFIAYDLVWDPLAPDPHEEIRVHTYTLKEALASTSIPNRWDPEAALVLWLYAQKEGLLVE